MTVQMRTKYSQKIYLPNVRVEQAQSVRPCCQLETYTHLVNIHLPFRRKGFRLSP